MNEIDKAFAAKTLAQQAAKNAAAAPVVLPPAPQVPASIRDIAPAAQPESASAIAAAGAAGGAGVAKPGMFSGAANRIKNAYNALRDIAPAATPAAGAGTPAGGTPAGGTPAGGTPAGGSASTSAAATAAAAAKPGLLSRIGTGLTRAVGPILEGARTVKDINSTWDESTASDKFARIGEASARIAAGEAGIISGGAAGSVFGPGGTFIGAGLGGAAGLASPEILRGTANYAAPYIGAPGSEGRSNRDFLSSMAGPYSGVLKLANAAGAFDGLTPSNITDGVANMVLPSEKMAAMRDGPSTPLLSPYNALEGNFAPDKLSGIRAVPAGQPGPQGDSFGPQDPNKTLYSPTPSAADPVVEDSNQFRTLSSMANLRSGPALTAADFNKPPVSAETLSGTRERLGEARTEDARANLIRKGFSYNQMTPEAVSKELSTEQARRDSIPGAGLLQRNTSAPGITNLGNYGGDSNIYATASTPGGRLNNFFGVGAKSQVYSSAPETAQDKALNAVTKSLSEGSGTENTVSGGGPSSRSSLIESEYAPQLERLKDFPKAYAELMQQKNNALAQDRQLVESGRVANAQLAVQGQGMRNTEAAGRRQDALTLLSQGNAAGATAQKAQEAADRQAADAEAQRRKDQETGRKSFNQEVDRLFNNTGGDDNKAREDREQFANFVSNTDIPRFLSAFADPTKFSSTNSLGDIYSLDPPDRAVAIAALKTGFETKKRMGKGGLFNPLPKNEGYVFPKGDPVKSTWADVGSNKLPVLTRLNDVLNPFADDRVQHMEDGTVVPFAELADNNSTAEAQLTAMRKTKPRQPTQ